MRRVWFNVLLCALKVILETIFEQVWWPNQPCQSTEGGWLGIQTALNLTGLTAPCYNNTLQHAYIHAH